MVLKDFLDICEPLEHLNISWHCPLNIAIWFYVNRVYKWKISSCRIIAILCLTLDLWYIREIDPQVGGGRRSKLSVYAISYVFSKYVIIFLIFLVYNNISNNFAFSCRRLWWPTMLQQYRWRSGVENSGAKKWDKQMKIKTNCVDNLTKSGIDKWKSRQFDKTSCCSW